MSVEVLSPREATRQVLDISVTERGVFRQCRRRWNLSTLENLQPRAHNEMPFSFGSGIHSSLEAFYKGEGEKAALDIWADWQYDMEDAAVNQEEYEQAYEHGELGHTMLKNYFEFDKTARVKLGRPLAVEGEFLEETLETVQPPGYPPDAQAWIHESGRVMVPIVDPVSKTPMLDSKGRCPHLTARIDLLTERSTPHRGVWVVDHKTAGSPPSDKALELEDQATGYCYVVFRWLGIIPRGVVWNVLLKEVPELPRIVQDKRSGRKGEDTLSSAKSQLTLPSMYREALKDWGYMKNGLITSKAHEDCLAALLARGWDPFFRRYELSRNEHELESFEARLLNEYWDMIDAYDDPDRLYPSPSQLHCPRCPVNRICLAIEDGSDFEDIISRQFEVGPDRKASK